MNKQVEKIFVDLIQKELNLPDNYGEDAQGNIIPCVTIKAQNIKLFNTPHIQITVSTASSNVFSNRKTYYQETITDPDTQTETTTYYEKLMLNEQRVIQIDVYSRNNEARERFWEIQAALSSTYAEQLADQYQFRIGKISNSFNLSGLDGGSDINRFTIRFNCLTWQEKIKAVDYYNSFRTQVRDTNTDIFADFTIQNNTVINN